MYVLLEGIDTTGKTTQIERLKELYPQMIATKEPGGTDLGKEIRKILLESSYNLSLNAELLLFIADRAEHYEKVIKPNKDNLIVSDRGFISGLAYALTNHPDLDLGYLIELNRFALGGSFPQKIIFFKTNKELLLSRISDKEHDIIEKRGIDYLLLVQENMEKILKSLDIEYLSLDASLSVDELHKQIKGFIND